jgi:hypothetical protein
LGCSSFPKVRGKWPASRQQPPPLTNQGVIMNKDAAIVELSELIVDITDPKLTRWRREQIATMARTKAKSYLKKQKEEK